MEQVGGFDQETEALLDRLQRAAFGYFEMHSHPLTGLVADTSRPGSPCSIAATGFALSSYPVACSRGWITRGEGAARVLAVLRFLSESPQGKAPDATGYRGLFYHFLDMETGRRTWNCELSLIDSAILMAGMLTAATFFDGEDAGEVEIRHLAQEIYARADWRFALGRQATLNMGWKPGSGFLRYRWTGYSEGLLLYILALGSPTHAIPAESYAAFAGSYAWTQVEGRPFAACGPLFTHLFAHAFMDLHGIADPETLLRQTDYVENTRLAIAAQRQYAGDNPGGFDGYGPDCWGLSACDGPKGSMRMKAGGSRRFRGYLARGVPHGPDDGTLVPWAAHACLPFAREASLRALAYGLAHFPQLLTDDRFPASFNPGIVGQGTAGWVHDSTVGIDQGLVVVMIEAARSGLPWRLARETPAIRRGLGKAGFTGGWLVPEPV